MWVPLVASELFTSMSTPGQVKSALATTAKTDVLKQDQEIEAVVLGINREEQKISLGVRQLESNPWDHAEEKYPPGTKVKGKIRNLTSYGAFIELEEGIDGMVHVSDISWTRKINHPSEVLKKGDEVEAVVLEVDRPNQRIALGVKQLTEDPWEHIDRHYKVGDLVTGKVTKLASFGAFIGLQNEIDGLVHISQVSEERVEKGVGIGLARDAPSERCRGFRHGRRLARRAGELQPNGVQPSFLIRLAQALGFYRVVLISTGN